MPIAITAGEPAGIGPEITAAALAQWVAQGAQAQDFVVIGARTVPERAAHAIGVGQVYGHHGVPIRDVVVDAPVIPGRLDPRNAAHVLAMLDEAIDGARAGRYAAVVTAPVHKGVINDAGTPFTGHTEYLAARCGVERVVMMLTAGASITERVLRVALATTHLPLRAVPDALSIDGLVQTLVIIERDLRTRFRIAQPRIAVTGLNPHAGEGGKMGTEEGTVIAPAIEAARRQGCDICGPLPADTLFHLAYRGEFDAVVAMYHDQGLGPMKMIAFDSGVNWTLGLPFIRTSPDHGTAFDIAGKGVAREGSMLAAIRLATRIRGSAL